VVVKITRDIYLGGLRKNMINTTYISYDSSFKTPNVIDLRDLCLSTNNQHNTPYCVGYSVASYLEVNNWKNTHIPIQLDAQKIYRCGREYKADTISGTKPEYCILNLIDNDVLSGDIVKFQSLVNIYNPDVLKMMIHSNGVIITGFEITDEWYNVHSGIITKKNNPKKLGLHCVLCCGYCDDGIYIQNSWGIKEWGYYGYAILPWELLITQFCYGVFIKNLVIKDNIKKFYHDGDNIC
jgi:hypothetical protein